MAAGLYYTYPKDRDLAMSKARALESTQDTSKSSDIQQAEVEYQALLSQGHSHSAQVELSPLDHEAFRLQ